MNSKIELFKETNRLMYEKILEQAWKDSPEHFDVLMSELKEHLEWVLDLIDFYVDKSRERKTE